jgi:hypothetical protein
LKELVLQQLKEEGVGIEGVGIEGVGTAAIEGVATKVPPNCCKGIFDTDATRRSVPTAVNVVCLRRDV